MTREEAIKGLKVLAKDFSGYKPNEEMFDMAIKALEQPELPAQPGWIPCSTALPKQDGDYLVTKKSFGWNCTEYIETDIARYEKKDGWHKADTVLAWCELPTPWEGGQE